MYFARAIERAVDCRICQNDAHAWRSEASTQAYSHLHDTICLAAYDICAEQSHQCSGACYDYRSQDLKMIRSGS